MEEIQENGISMASRMFNITLHKPSKGIISKASASGATMLQLMSALKKQMSRTMTDLDKKHNSKMFDNATGARQGHGKTRLGVRSGKLRSSYKNKVNASGTTVTGTRGSDSGYAGIHEFGGTIKPKKAKWLWIPIRENKMSPTELFNQKWAIKDWGGGKATAYLITGKKNVKPVFALRKEVKIPKRDILLQAFRDTMPSAEKKFIETVARVLEGN